jgi:hypothetical protein
MKFALLLKHSWDYLEQVERRAFFYDEVQKRDRLSRQFSPVAFLKVLLSSEKDLRDRDSEKCTRPTSCENERNSDIFSPYSVDRGAMNSLRCWKLRKVVSAAPQKTGAVHLNFYHPNGAVNFLCTVGSCVPY